MFYSQSDAPYYRRCIRQDRRALALATIRRALLWLPAYLGSKLAQAARDDQEDIIKEARYSIEEDGQNLWKTTLSFDDFA